MAQIALDAEVSLLRVGVDEVLGLRIAEGLEAQRQERPASQVQVVLVEELRLGKVQRLELLLVRQIAEVGIGRWRQ